MPRYAMSPKLRWVAYLFLFNGVCAMISMPVSFLQGRFILDFSILGIFAYFGLMRLSNGWRFYALFCTWLAIILFPVIGVLALTAPHANLTILGFTGPEIPPFLVTLNCIFWLIVAIWQLKVLTSPDIKAEFTAEALTGFR